MLGAIAGDIVGSRFERHNIKSKDFDFLTSQCRPTDDSIMTLAVAQAVLDAKANPETLCQTASIRMQELGNQYPDAGYGGQFRLWLANPDPHPYGSYGNGSAMRTSPCGWAGGTLDEALRLAHAAAAVTHNHAEGIKGAEATTAAIWLARQGQCQAAIKAFIQTHYYPLDFTIRSIRSGYTFDATCQGSVPQAIEAFLEADGFEDAIRNAVSLGGDSDTIAAIAGSIAEARFGIPNHIRSAVLAYLDDFQRAVLTRFENQYPPSLHPENL